MSAGVEVRGDERVLEVRLPSWLTDDERQAIADGVERLIESRGHLGAVGYAERVAAEVRRVMDADGLDEGHLRLFLGCARTRAAALWSGWRPYKLDELAAVADALDVPLMALAAPGVEVQRTDGDEVEGRRYATRDECVAREIVEPLGEYAAEHDVEAIADEVVESDGRAFWVAVDVPTFWKVVERHAVD